jgi:hypothetical protein
VSKLTRAMEMLVENLWLTDVINERVYSDLCRVLAEYEPTPLERPDEE